jgi:hypothetical protein
VQAVKQHAKASAAHRIVIESDMHSPE